MDGQTGTIVVYALIGIAYILVGASLGIGVPFAITALRQRNGHGQVKLNEKKHQQNVIQGKQSQPSLQAKPTTI